MRHVKYLVWVDLETTGLDPDHHDIIEVGLVLTTASSPFDEIWSLSSCAMPPDLDWESRMGLQVERMHSQNGLLEEVHDHGRSIRDIELEIINALHVVGRPHEFMLAGSGVSHFDRRFIKTQMGGMDKWLQHPSLDVGTIRRALKFSGREDLDGFGMTFNGADKPHRGLADVRDHLNEWRHYAVVFEEIERLDADANDSSPR